MTSVERAQFTFYRSYYEAISALPKKDQTAVLLAVCAYALDNKEPNLSGTANAVFTLIRPTLDTGRRKAQSGKRGGENASKAEANGKQTASKAEAKPKQTASEKEVEVEGEKEVEIENDSSKKSIKKSSPKKEATPPIVADYSGTTFSPEMVATVDAWLRYKQERREPYKSTGLKSLITEIQNNAKRYGESAVMEVITYSMAANYKGIVFDRLKEGRQYSRTETKPGWMKGKGMPGSAGAPPTGSMDKYLQLDDPTPEVQQEAEEMQRRMQAKYGRQPKE